ncbi:MAG TPA: OmpH family outer membrane protein [Candidatus Tyrphobacter sp.]
MNKITTFIGLFTILLAGCAPSSSVGLVDTSRIVANWSQYQGYQAQLMMQEQTIAQSHVSNAQKQSEAQQLQVRYGRITQQLTAEVQNAASQVARQRGLKLVLTRQGVGYGGIDITPDVEKILNITERATPAPTSS